MEIADLPHEREAFNNKAPPAYINRQGVLAFSEPVAYASSSLVNTPQKYKETPLWHVATEKCNAQNRSDWAKCPMA